jgi:hypothetical protein
LTNNNERYFNYSAILVTTLLTIGIFAYIISGRVHHWEQHASFLWGIGSIPIQNLTGSITNKEPKNALSIPTWTIHWMSVTEYLYAMRLIWQFSNLTISSAPWKGLTWGMLPLHASSICAVTHHIFYNHSHLEILVTIQAALTLLGNTTTAIAAWRIVHYQTDFHHRRSHRSVSTSPVERVDSDFVLWSKILGLPIALAYLVKYGEIILLEEQVTQPNKTIAMLLVVGIPSIAASYYAILSWRNGAEMDYEEDIDHTVVTHEDDTTANTSLLKKSEHDAVNSFVRTIVDEQSPLLPRFSV